MDLKKNMKSDFDEFLKEEDIFEEVNNNAIKKVIAYQIAQEMKQQNITQTELAKMMNTSRTVIHKLLNPENNSLTLQSLQSVANALGKRLSISLV
ncbi:XRE family transcriptional regulator [Aliarcobacter butzleri]|jgi:predicted XRE-type DNA-binding protein|uniref:Fis family transcriptional regulator n=1 Tax=Aliarcobacter butzleri L355 TaxID=1447263 RepID=A0A0G9KYF5_9BACT|nr:XRE family transcriptional regulator [Aliarcobacter butzleri]KLE11612.1 Fis family transcriptional regulator [Aliarcobacter butzleri L355]